MTSKYIFSEEEIVAIEEARKKNKDKHAEVRLKALKMRAKRAKAQEVAEQTGFYPTTITRLVEKYRKNGLEAISGKHYGGNHRIMAGEEESAILALFRERAEKGKLVGIKEIKAAY